MSFRVIRIRCHGALRIAFCARVQGGARGHMRFEFAKIDGFSRGLPERGVLRWVGLHRPFVQGKSHRRSARHTFTVARADQLAHALRGNRGWCKRKPVPPTSGAQKCERHGHPASGTLSEDIG